MKLSEIAKRIHAHLKRFEADPAVASRPDPRHPDNERAAIAQYYNGGAWASGRYVGIKYISYQPEYFLTKQEALAYLAWLDAGNVGRHYEAQRAVTQ